MMPVKSWSRMPWQRFLRAYSLNDTTARYWKNKFNMKFKVGKDPETGKRCAMITRKQVRQIIDAIHQVHMKGD